MASLASAARLNDRTVSRAIRWLAVLLPIGLIAVGGFYWLDRHPAPGPTLGERNVTAAEQAVRDAPNDLAVRNHLAAAYVSAGRFDDGIAQFTQVLSASPTDRAALLGRGLAYKTVEQYEEAAADFQALVVAASAGEFADSDPQLERAYYELGATRLAEGRPAEAASAAESALAINGADADALYVYGTALIQSANPTKGVAALRHAVQFVPTGWCEPYAGLVTGYTALANNIGVSYATAMVAMCEGRLDEARSGLQALTGGDMKIDALLGLGLVAAQAGDAATARDMYGQVLTVDPGNTSAAIGLSQLPAQEGN